MGIDKPIAPKDSAGRAIDLAGRLLATLAVMGLTLVVGGLLVFIVPKFERIFAEFGAQLPASTSALLDVSRLLRQYWFLAAPLPLAVLAALMVLVWKGRAGWAWAVLIAAILGLIGFLTCTVLALFMPLISIVQAARKSPSGGP